VREVLRQAERDGQQGLGDRGVRNAMLNKGRFTSKDVNAALASLVKKGKVVKRGSRFQSFG